MITGTLTGLTGASGMSVLISGLLLLKIGIRDIIGLTFVVTFINSITATIPIIKKGNLRDFKAAYIAIPSFFAVFLGNQFSGALSGELLTMIITVTLFMTGIKFIVTKQKDSVFHRGDLKKRSILMLVLLGLVCGTIMGIMGGGGGVFISAVLLMVFKFPVKEAIGISIIVMGASAVSGIYVNYINGNIHFFYAMIIIIPSMICAYVASHFMNDINAEIIKRVLGIYLVIVSSVLMLKYILNI